MKLEVEHVLEKKGVYYRILTLTGKVVTHEDVKKHSKEDPEDDCKTIVAKDKEGNLYAFFLRGMMKIDFSKVKNVIGKVSILSLEELKKTTGMSQGKYVFFC